MDAPLWKLLATAAKPGAEKPSAEAVRAAVEADLTGATSWSYRDLSAHLRDVMRLTEAAQRCESLFVDAHMLLNDFTPDDLCQPPPNGLGLSKVEGAAVMKLIADIKAANG